MIPDNHCYFCDENREILKGGTGQPESDTKEREQLIRMCLGQDLFPLFLEERCWAFRGQIVSASLPQPLFRLPSFSCQLFFAFFKLIFRSCQSAISFVSDLTISPWVGNDVYVPERDRNLCSISLSNIRLL